MDAPAPEVDREVLAWGEVGDATQALARSIVADDYRPDVVLAIARGGLIVAAALAYALGVKNTFTLNVEFYTGVDERVGEVRFATLYEKPRSAVKCEYVWRRTDRWITFPWSALPPLYAGGAG